LKNLDHRDPNKTLEYIKKLQNEVETSAFEIDRREDIKVHFRVDESIGPAMFKPDPLVPGGYKANSLTLQAMRPNLFVLGESTLDLSTSYNCACGKELDIQFWKLCPYCARTISL
jgi:hypothetical protein